MMEPVEEYELRGNKILRIYQDEVTESPRDWDNLSRIVCWHKRYILGDKEARKEYPTPDHFNRNDPAFLFCLPLYMYDHSIVTISLDGSRWPFTCRWDAGQVGWVFVLKKDIRKEWGVKRISPKLKQKVRGIVEAEVQTYDQFLKGEIYGFVLVSRTECAECGHIEEEDEDSCWGFYGYDIQTNGILDHLPSEIGDQLRKEKANGQESAGSPNT